MKKVFSKKDWLLSLFFFVFLILIFFWKFFLKGLLPIPADITVGLYYPWLDYKWGFPTGAPVKNPLPSDIPSLVYPWRIFVIEQLKKGILPLWNPYCFGGMPLLANFQSAVFSLANIFFVFLPAIYAWSAGVMVQPFLTGLFTFFFLRRLRVRQMAALLGGTVFAFCGFNFMWLEYNVHGHTGMWLPVLLLGVDKIVVEKKWSWVLLGSFILAFQIFAGYPQIALYSLTAAGFYALFRLFFLWKAGQKWQLLAIPALFLVVFVALGLSLAAVQILPGMEALRLSVRKIDPLAEHSSGGFLPWQNLITFLAPDFFGNPSTYNFWGRPWYDNFALYVGIFPLVLATLAVFLRRDKLSWFFTFLSFFALFLALPTPISRFVNDLGIYGVKAIPAKSIFLLNFSLAILAAMGLDWWLACSSETHHWSKKLKEILQILVLFFLFFVGLWEFAFLIGRFFPRADWLVYLKIARRNLILPSGLFIAAALILISSHLFKSKKRLIRYFLFLAPIAIIFFSTFDLFRFGWKYLPFSKPELVFPTTPVIEFLQSQEKPFRVEFGEAIPQNMWMPYGLESAAGYDAMAPLRYNQFLGAVRTGRADTPYGRVAQVESYDSPLFDLLNIKYLLAVKYDEKGIRGPGGNPRPVFAKPKFELVFEEKTVQIYKNLKVLPRSFLVHDYVVKTNGQEIINQLLNPQFNFLKSIVLEEKVVLEKKKFDAKQDSVSYLKYDSQESIVKTFSEAEGILFLADSFYPGWRAFVDNRETKIYRANFAFRAVPVPAGEHKVRFVYDPPRFRLGLFISLATLIIILAEVGAAFFVKIVPRAVAKIIKLFKL